MLIDLNHGSGYRPPSVVEAINARIDAALAQVLSDRAVNILRATDARELLPRHTTNPDHFECRMCSWRERCWSLS